MKTTDICNRLKVALKHSALALAAMTGLAIGSAQALTYSLTGNGPNGYSEYGGEADGYQFTTGAAMLELSWLGFYDAPNGEEGSLGDDLLASHRVSVWRQSDGVLIAQTTVVPGDTLVGNFRGQNVTPVNLAANTAYVIAADYGGGDRMQEGDDLTGWGINGITLQGGLYGGAGGGMPTDGWSRMIGPNFGYSLAPLSVTLTSPTANQAYSSGSAITVSATVVEPGAFTDTVTFHVTPTVPAGPTVQTVSPDTSSPFSADLGVLPSGIYQIYATVANNDVPPGTATSATRTFTVEAAIATTTVLAAAGPATTYGENVTLTATVSPVPTGGTVQFLDGVGYVGSPVAVNTTTGEATLNTTALGAGTRVITAEYSGFQIYEGSTTAASISQVVGKAPLTVTASNVVRTVNTANPNPLSYQITGYQNDEDLATSGVTGTPTLSTTAVLSSPVGPYPITCAVDGLAAANYSFTPVNGTLTVTDLACQVGVLNLGANGGINPATGNPWALGDTYRLVLITSTTTQATSSDIATYNAFVNTVADSSTAFPALGSVTWKVVGSTATVDARDNTGTNPGSGTGVSIVRMDGTTIIANNNADLWDGISAPVNLDENGAFRLDDRVFTGTLPDGTKVTGAADQPLGSFGEGLGNIRVGYSEGTDGGWMTVFNHPHTEFSSVFAMSDVLTIVSTTPSNTFTTWAAANAGGQTASEDFDNDGVDNGIEYFMGQTGSSFTANPSLNASNVISWPASATYEGTYEVQTSPDLATWTNVDPRPLVVDGTLSYTLPTGLGKRFVRLLVTPTP